jgi:hypothetical protein
METSNVTQCMNELLQLYVSDVQPRLQLATAQAMCVALDKCSDVVHITDQKLNVQVNTCVCNTFVSSNGKWALDWVCRLHYLAQDRDWFVHGSEAPCSIKRNIFTSLATVFFLRRVLVRGVSVFSVHFSFCSYVLPVVYFRARSKNFDKRLLASSCLAACPPAGNNMVAAGRIFMKFGIWAFFENLLRNTSFIKIRRKWLVLYVKTCIHLR